MTSSDAVPHHANDTATTRSSTPGGEGTEPFLSESLSTQHPDWETRSQSKGLGYNSRQYMPGYHEKRLPRVSKPQGETKFQVIFPSQSLAYQGPQDEGSNRHMAHKLHTTSGGGNFRRDFLVCHPRKVLPCTGNANQHKKSTDRPRITGNHENDLFKTQWTKQNCVL